MDVIDTPKKEIQDMNVMELIEEITETTKIVALNLWGTSRERTNIAIDECAQKMKDIRLKANKSRLSEAFDNITITLRVFETLNEITDSKVIWKSVQDIVEEMLDKDDESLNRRYKDDESLTTTLVPRAIATVIHNFLKNYESSSCIVGKGLTPAVGLS